MTDFYFLDNCNFPLLKSEHSKINIKLNLSRCLYYMLTIIDVFLEKKILFQKNKMGDFKYCKPMLPNGFLYMTFCND